MDIVLTKDGKFVVSHDFNLRRLANKNSYIYNLNLKEIVGIKTRQNGNEGRYVSFDEYVEKAKKLGRAFANLALAKAQVKNKRSSNFRYKKDIRQARNSKTQ